MTGFNVDWLDLREAADQRARNGNLLERARCWLETSNSAASGVTVVDLGAGTGSTLRAFSPRAGTVPEALTWRLVDHDPALLAEARSRHATLHRLETYVLDLAEISALPLEGARLVTASALFDLVSATFIDRLAAELQSRCRQQPVGLYAALSYDGRMLWSPAHPMDEAVRNAFNHHQHRDKGFGLALGPDAGRYLEKAFTRCGFSVLSASSPWVLGGNEVKLVDALIGGIGVAVAMDPALDAASLEDWIGFRKAHVRTGTCTVRHTDHLALPLPA
jgi:SAM-dependent methyltransferase